MAVPLGLFIRILPERGRLVMRCLVGVWWVFGGEAAFWLRGHFCRTSGRGALAGPGRQIVHWSVMAYALKEALRLGFCMCSSANFGTFA